MIRRDVHRPTSNHKYRWVVFGGHKIEELCQGRPDQDQESPSEPDDLMLRGPCCPGVNKC